MISPVAVPVEDDHFMCGRVLIHVMPDEAAMGDVTADAVASDLKDRAGNGAVVLWLMAAPSAFPFYQALIAKAGTDAVLCTALRETHFFQFDDYPISRSSAQFPATFRNLLETSLYKPLEKVCGALKNVHALELAGGAGDRDVQRRYRDDLLALKQRGARLIELKGTGMDGHWGFHGAETPLDQKPDMIVVPMNSQNVRQQMLDWPNLFPTIDQVPKQAVTFNVPMFMLADRVLDNTPQAQKEFAVLAAYGTERVIQDVPSSALKNHACAEAYITRKAARALMEFRAGREKNPDYRLSPETHARLCALWDDPRSPESARQNSAKMDAVLKKLGMI